jgi:hypothetical protein
LFNTVCWKYGNNLLFEILFPLFMKVFWGNCFRCI